MGAFFSVKMRPLAGLDVVAAGAGGGGGPDVVVLDGHAVDHVVDQAAVELVEVVEAAAAEAGEAAAEQSQPDVAGLRVDVDGGDDLPGQDLGPSRPFCRRPCFQLRILPVRLSRQASPSSVPIQTLGPSALTAKMWSLGRPSLTVKCFHLV